MKIASIVVSDSLCRAALRLPDNARIVNVRMTDDRGLMTFLVECDDFAECEDGGVIPDIQPQITVTRLKCGCEHASWNWNHPPLDASAQSDSILEPVRR